MTDQKLTIRSKYEKYQMLLVWPHAEGTNKRSKTHDSVKTQMKRMCACLGPDR